MPRNLMVESLESRQVFAAVSIEAATFYDACVAADTDSSLTLSKAEAGAYVGVIKGQITSFTADYKAEVKQATAASAGNLRSLASQYKEDLAGAAKADRKGITATYTAAVKTQKASLKTQLAELRADFVPILIRGKAAQTLFTSISKVLGKPFATDLNGDRQLDLHSGDNEFGALLARDDNGANFSTRDLAGVSRVVV